MRILSLGIPAHVDAGKTSLTERLLHAAGVIAEPGSVDDGNPQTDTLAPERRRERQVEDRTVTMTRSATGPGGATPTRSSTRACRAPGTTSAASRRWSS